MHLRLRLVNESNSKSCKYDTITPKINRLSVATFVHENRNVSLFREGRLKRCSEKHFIVREYILDEFYLHSDLSLDKACN